MLRLKVVVAGLAGIAMCLPMFAHVDDPKALPTAPKYVGPGYRAQLDGAPPDEFVSFAADEGPQLWLRAWLPLDEMSPMFNTGNDCWGYVSPSGREYAIFCGNEGTAFVEVTTPFDPQVIDVFPGAVSVWRDAKVYANRAYVVADSGASGIQVFDLTDIDNGNIVEVGSFTDGAGTGNTHNVAINTDSGFLYRCGGGGHGLRIYDLSNPDSPQFVNSWPDRYVHDAQIVSYVDGPYAGREIAFCCGGLNNGSVDTGLDIIDVTDKQNLVHLAHVGWEGGEYSHQAWLSPDRRYLYVNDEGDENGSNPTRTIVIDVGDIESPTVVNTFLSDTNSIGHNLYMRGDYIFESNYSSGLKVFDAHDPVNPVLVASWDTRPENDAANFEGMWSNYPFFPSGTVIGSDRQRGLFIWRFVPPPLPGDATGDRVVDIADMLAILADWGLCDFGCFPSLPFPGCEADLNRDCSVDIGDLLAVLENFGISDPQ